MSYLDLYKRTKQAVDSNAFIFLVIALCLIGGLGLLLLKFR